MTATNAEAEVLEEVEAKYGFVPNLFREMARSPAVARVYLRGQEAMDEARLSVPERQAVQLAIAVYNECPYCRAALNRGGLSESGHSGRGHRGGREGRSAGAPRLRSLVSAAWQVLDTRGWLGASELATLEGEGVDRSEVYEVVALIGLKTISNYINHMAHTPVDEAFRK